MQKSNQSSLIIAEQQGDFDRWNPPEVFGETINADQIDARKNISGSMQVNRKVSAQNVEQIREAAYQEGLAKGQADGKSEIRKEQQHIVDSLNTVLEECHNQQGNFDQQICDQLVSITISVAKQLIRRELTIEPDQIMAVIRDAINCLPSSSEKIILKLHPEDATLVRNTYNLNDEPDLTWKIFEDPGMQRGGCIINSESSVVNADLDHRIATIVSQLLGGERSDD